MMRIRIITWLLFCGLLLALSGCGNKGPLVLPEEEQEKNKSENS
jgi:predicted small lipoprotein YifL